MQILASLCYSLIRCGLLWDSRFGLYSFVVVRFLLLLCAFFLSYCCLCPHTRQVTGVFNSDYEVHGDGYSWYSGSTKVLYPSEGFVVELPLKALDASNYLAKLEANDWIDERTRAVFVEFSVYNVHVDHFAAVLGPCF